LFSRQRPVAGWILPPPRDSQLLPERVAMRLPGSRRDTEPLAHLLVRTPLGDERHHLTLPRRNRREGLCEDLVHGATVTPVPVREHRPNGVFDVLRRRPHCPPADAARLVASRVRLAELVLVERSDPQ